MTGTSNVGNFTGQAGAGRRLRVLFPAVLLASSLIAVRSLALADDFQGLDTLGGTYSSAAGVSDDGGVVVGYSNITGDAAIHSFRWSGGTMTDLGTLGGANSYAFAVSGDGAVVVGDSDITGNTATHAFRWSGGTMTDLGTLGGTYSAANAVSDDGAVVVGYGEIAGNAASHAFRWSNGPGMTDLGTLGGLGSSATGVSGDGAVVVGYSDITGNTETHAFRWSSGTGMSDLGTLGGFYSAANGVSGDGAVVVGYSYITGNSAQHAFRWSGGTGMSDLGTLGGASSAANAVSGDGAVVVGQSYITGNAAEQAFRWTAATGMKSIQGLLTASGVNTTGWQLQAALGVSADGSVIVGNGQDPSSQTEAWIARLCDLAGTCQSGGGTGLITVSDQLNSFASVGDVGQTASASLGMNFNTVTNYAMQGGTPTSPGSPFSAFTAFGYDSDPTVAGTLGGTAKLNDRGLIAGATLGADNIRTTNMYDGGSARMNAGTFGLFIAQVPDAGWQWLAGANAIYLGGKISRGYLNGASQVTSTGSTHGEGYGFAGRLGYTFANVLPRTSLTPFASYTYTRVTFAGYTETDGPFPAAMDSFHDAEQISRVGADARYTFKPGTWTWGTLAWGHRLDAGNSPDVSGTLIGLFPLSTSGGAINKRDWAEVTAGIRYGAWKNGAVTASLTASIPANAPTTYAAQFGVSQAF
jgi:probable HAF family extracellular repeat protein